MKIIDFFKQFIEVKDEDLSFLNVGDIIWAKRYQTEEEKQKIHKWHQESPYVVIKKVRKKVYALQCTSNPHQEVKWHILYYHLGRLQYDMNKNCYINCLSVHELKRVQVVKMLGQLEEYDLNQLKKQLYILINSNFKFKPQIEKKYLDYKIGIGDIIFQNNNRYYIYDKDDTYLYVYRLRNHTKNNMHILINNTYYSFIFLPEQIKIKSKYTLVNTFNTGEIEIINKYREQELEKQRENKKNGKTLRIGAIIDYNDKMYYVYDENEESLFVYQVYSNSLKEKGLIIIKIKGGLYKTFFATTTIKRGSLSTNGYKVRRCASLEEIKLNDKLLRTPKKDRVKEGKKVPKFSLHVDERNIDDFIPMTILKNDNNQKYYLVIGREENTIEVVNINQIDDTFYFELEKGNCPFRYYRILSKEEYDIYIEKIQDLKELTATFSR